MVTTQDLVEKLHRCYVNHKGGLHNTEDEDCKSFGRKRGWLEEQDLLWYKGELDRRSAARIIHEFLRIEFDFPEVPDWNRAKKLLDLYDCRVCAKHVAWVYEMNIMSAPEERRFMLVRKIEEDTLANIIDKIEELLSK